MKIRRSIRSYDLNTENLIGEVELVDIPVDLLRKIFHVEGEDTMYDCYIVSKH